jgi:hypothetical protein
MGKAPAGALEFTRALVRIRDRGAPEGLARRDRHLGAGSRSARRADGPNAKTRYIQSVIVDFILELRRHGVKVGPLEAVQLARALELGLHDSSLDGFYDVARALCVHREGDLDAFDRAFAVKFKGVDASVLTLRDELDKWLRDPIKRARLTDDERKFLQSLDVDQLRKLLEERLREQTERHDGGSKWVGTGGKSPFGTDGENPSGVRIGRGGQRTALAVAEQRKFKAYRSDVVLDVRSMEMALRRLRSMAREGAEDELDLEATIDATAKSGGELDIVLRAPRKPNVKVLLLMDVGGSMDPHAQLVSRMFSAAKRASNFKRLEPYYFHNAIYGRIYRDANLRDALRVSDALAQFDRTWKLVVLGDALMHPGELLGYAWDPELNDAGWGELKAVDWMTMLSKHFDRTAWLNPEPSRYWTGTAELLKRIFPMYELTLDGLGEAVRHLSKHAPV